MDYTSPLSESEKLGIDKSTNALSAPSKFDNSDKKSLDLLLQGSIFNKARNYKQASISTYLASPSKAVSDMKRKAKARRKKIGSPKKDTRKSHRNSSDDNSPKLTDLTWLRKTKSSKCDNKAQEVEKKSSSFAKYGVHIQSVEDILKEIKDCAKYKECLENLTPTNTSLCLPQVTENEPESKENVSTDSSSPSNAVSDMKRKVKSRRKKIGSPKKDTHKSHKNSSYDNSPKLTDMTWLRKAKSKRDDKPQEEKKKKLSSSSFTKYGMHLQSFEDILKEMKDSTKYKKCLEDLTPIDTSLCLPQVTENEPEAMENILDCKYMTREEIKSAFHRHFDYLQEICSGQRYSERHSLYLRSRSCNNRELNYNTSMIVFTGEQKQVLANLLYRKFGDSSLDGHYYFKVLLPEICLKIFMEEHDMSYAEASDYLKQRPVDA